MINLFDNIPVKEQKKLETMLEGITLTFKKNMNISKNLKDNITVSAVKDTELIQITVTNYYPDRASDIANEIAKVFTKKVGEIYNINNV